MPTGTVRLHRVLRAPPERVYRAFLAADAVVTPSSGNVFVDLGFGPGEAAVMGLRADLMARLRLLVQTDGWTQAQAAEKFGIAQSRVSELLRGKWDKFSPDMLITLAARDGQVQPSG